MSERDDLFWQDLKSLLSCVRLKDHPHGGSVRRLKDAVIEHFDIDECVRCGEFFWGEHDCPAGMLA